VRAFLIELNQILTQDETVQTTITVKSGSREVLVDITKQVERELKNSGMETGICSVCVRGATAGIMIGETLIEHFFLIEKSSLNA
jgi:thiamine phosphate synthase YjbQ (UPF0047 family)